MFAKAKYKQKLKNWDRTTSKKSTQQSFKTKREYVQFIANNLSTELEKISHSPKNGVVTKYFENGKIRREYEVIGHKKNGDYKEFHENGQLRVEIKFRDGIQQDGWVISYHDNGNKAREVYVENESYKGEFQEWHSDGKLKLKGIYKDDQVVEILYKSEDK